MAWTWLVLAGCCEILWAVGLKLSDGLSKPLISVLTIVGMILSFVLLSHAMKTLPLGTAYAVWTGIGAVGAALVGCVAFGEPATAWRLGCIALIAVGIMGLKFGG